MTGTGSSTSENQCTLKTMNAQARREMAGSHHIAGSRVSGASDNDPGTPDNRNPEGEVNHQMRWDK